MSKKVLMTENQVGLLLEYDQVSNPKTDSNILGKLTVWVYGNDRDGYTPHCHVIMSDGSMEAELSIIDFSVINIKTGTFTKKMLKKLINWTMAKTDGVTNLKRLYTAWDDKNGSNTLLDFITKHGIKIENPTLLKYLNDSLSKNAKEKR